MNCPSSRTIWNANPKLFIYGLLLRTARVPWRRNGWRQVEVLFHCPCALLTREMRQSKKSRKNPQMSNSVAVDLKFVVSGDKIRRSLATSPWIDAYRLFVGILWAWGVRIFDFYLALLRARKFKNAAESHSYQRSLPRRKTARLTGKVD